jgi:hypothetical protein
MLAWVLVISLIGVLIEYRTFLKNNRRREVIASAILMLGAILLGLLRLLRISIPSPLLVIRWIFHPASQLLVKWLS